VLEKISRGAEPMTPHDQSIAWNRRSPAARILMLAIASVFFAGMAAGGFLFAYTDQPPLHLAANDVAAHPSQPTLPTTQ